MKITVLNGSPKGSSSVTMQYVAFVQKKFPQHEFNIHNVAQHIGKLERNEEAFREIMREVASSDGVLWASPLYYFLVPSQYKRFIELIFERHAEAAFHNRYTAVLTTSIHFFDHTAHNYLRAICDDLGMRYVGFYSADMYDLLKDKERAQTVLFAEEFFRAVEKKITTSRTYFPVVHPRFEYKPGLVGAKLEGAGEKVMIVSDEKRPGTNLEKMVGRFADSFLVEPRTMCLADIAIKGGCLGCLRCGYDNECIYNGKDGFSDFFHDAIEPADILVFAGTIKDRYLSSDWKMFFDRGFFKNHTPYLGGKQIAFVISGPMSQIPNLLQIIEAYAQMHGARLVGIVTDESGDSLTLDAELGELAGNLLWSAQKGSMGSATFLGVGGRKVFRDEIRARLRFPFRADDDSFKKLGFYDFPQKDYKARITSKTLLLLSKIPRIRRKIYSRMKDEMIKPLQKVIRTA
jgi:multimeric flavodoxin WrbA